MLNPGELLVWIARPLNVIRSVGWRPFSGRSNTRWLSTTVPTPRLRVSMAATTACTSTMWSTRHPDVAARIYVESRRTARLDCQTTQRNQVRGLAAVQRQIQHALALNNRSHAKAACLDGCNYRLHVYHVVNPPP